MDPAQPCCQERALALGGLCRECRGVQGPQDTTHVRLDAGRVPGDRVVVVCGFLDISTHCLVPCPWPLACCHVLSPAPLLPPTAPLGPG